MHFGGLLFVFYVRKCLFDKKLNQTAHNFSILAQKGPKNPIFGGFLDFSQKANERIFLNSNWR